MSWFGTSQLKLSLEISQGHVHVAHGHRGIGVAEQFHYGREAHARAKHFGSVGMSHLVRNDIYRKTDGVADHVQVLAKPGKETCLASRPCQQPSIGRQRIQSAEEAQAVNEIANEGIDWDHAFGFKLAERDMNGPLIRTGRAQAVIR